MKKLAIILASTRRERLGKTIAAWALTEAEKDNRFSASLIDLADFPLPQLDSGVSPIADKSAEELVAAWSAVIADAEAYLIVSPEYNHGYSGTFKNALDTLKAEWIGKPAGVLGYGGLAGGARSMEQLRLVLIELQLRPTYSSVLIPMAWEAFTDDGQPKHSGVAKQLAGVLNELSWL